MKFDNFDSVYCINLEERKDRRDEFLCDVPDELFVEFFDAIDGKKFLLPDWWPGGPGGYGCYLSHKRIIERAIQADYDSILILEDDAKFKPDFYKKMLEFNAELPDDAEYVFYGGQLSYVDTFPPEKVSDNVVRVFSVERTHAYALFGQDIMRRVHKHLCNCDWHRGHIDSRLTLLQQKLTTCYAPARWLVDQRKSYSDLMRKEVDYHFDDPIDLVPN